MSQVLTDEELYLAKFDARQQGIRECIADLAQALHSESGNWTQLIELAGLYRDIVVQERDERAKRASLSN